MLFKNWILIVVPLPLNSAFKHNEMLLLTTLVSHQSIEETGQWLMSLLSVDVYPHIFAVLKYSSLLFLFPSRVMTNYLQGLLTKGMMAHYSLAQQSTGWFTLMRTISREGISGSLHRATAYWDFIPSQILWNVSFTKNCFLENLLIWQC